MTGPGPELSWGLDVGSYGIFQGIQGRMGMSLLARYFVQHDSGTAA